MKIRSILWESNLWQANFIRLGSSRDGRWTVVLTVVRPQHGLSSPLPHNQSRTWEISGRKLVAISPSQHATWKPHPQAPSMELTTGRLPNHIEFSFSLLYGLRYLKPGKFWYWKPHYGRERNDIGFILFYMLLLCCLDINTAAHLTLYPELLSVFWNPIDIRQETTVSPSPVNIDYHCPTSNALFVWRVFVFVCFNHLETPPPYNCACIFTVFYTSTSKYLVVGSIDQGMGKFVNSAQLPIGVLAYGIQC